LSDIPSRGAVLRLTGFASVPDGFSMEMVLIETWYYEMIGMKMFDRALLAKLLWHLFFPYKH